jgi:uncharacterized protein (DUF488 family)
MAKRVYTIGYEGKTINEFIDQLKKSGVKRVADVRKITSSRKRDFSKTKFSEILAKNDIEYVGMRELGTPNEVRRFYKSGGALEEFLHRYEKYIDTVTEAMKKLESVAGERPTAIMCFENDFKKCHRQVLSKRLQKKGFEVENL